MKYTKGKWEFDQSVSENYFPIYSDNKLLVAEVNNRRPLTGLVKSVTEEERQEFEANAKLIAKAPEMLEALKKVLMIVNESEGVAGYHLNGEVAEWDEFDEINEIESLIKELE